MKLIITIDVDDVDPLRHDPWDVAAEALNDLDGDDRFSYDGPPFVFVSAEWGTA